MRHNATALVMFVILAVDADTAVAFSLVTLLLADLVTLDSYSPKEVMITICDHLVAKCPLVSMCYPRRWKLQDSVLIQ